MLSHRLTTATPGQPVSLDVFVKGQAQLGITIVLMAIEYTQTRSGVEAIYRAELDEFHGLKRQPIVTRAAQRLDWFDKRKIPQANLESV